MKPKRLFALLAFLLVTAFSGAGRADVDVVHFPDGPIGKQVAFFKETGGRLSVADAVARFAAGDAAQGMRDTLDFMIGSDPVWLKFDVVNATSVSLLRRVTIETSWLDRIDIHVRHNANTVALHSLGDALPYGGRLSRERFYSMDHAFQPGISTVYIRVATPDPMPLPIYLTDIDTAERRNLVDTYSYGFIYGGVFALLMYNALLFFSLRKARYILYAIYLASFLATNASYTGHLFAWAWPTWTTWQLWSNPVLMHLYAISGLLFATRFLETRTAFPRLHRILIQGIVAVTGVAAVLIATDTYPVFIVQAFVVILVFSVVMLFLGVRSVAAGSTPARYFLAASFIAMIGAALTALAVWGVIPYNFWTYRTVEVGMLLDAVLLALALAHQFRIEERDKYRALQLARIDPLTRINNRRAFYSVAQPLWSAAQRNQRPISVILVDIDHFKDINDAFGHAEGDRTLVEAAQTLVRTARESDVPARWGGEEFILLLPDTDIADAVHLAERLRRTLDDLRVETSRGTIRFTVSAGVAEKDAGHYTLEDVIALADRCLYKAKRDGRDRVCGGSTGEKRERATQPAGV